MVIESGKRKADKPVTDFLSTLPEKSVFGVDFKEREIEGTNEVGDKRVRVPRVDDADRHNPSGTFLRSFSQENAETFAKDGFTGIVDTKTKFTVGEQNNKEFVTVKPNKSILEQQMDFFSSPMKTKKNNNIFDVGF